MTEFLGIWYPSKFAARNLELTQSYIYLKGGNHIEHITTILKKWLSTVPNAKKSALTQLHMG